MKPLLWAGLAAGVTIPALGLSLRYRREMNAARARLAAVLVVHGIFHNCVGGLLSVRDLFPDRRVIAPSRFGYLGSSLPPNATPAAQADAFAALLDALNFAKIDVIGLSAGATSSATNSLISLPRGRIAARSGSEEGVARRLC